MPRTLLAFGLAAALVAPALAQEPATKPAVNVEDKDALNKYFSERFTAIAKAVGTDAAEAEKALKAMKADLEAMTPDAAEAKAMVDRAKSTVKAYEEQIELGKISMVDLEAKLKTDPDDVDTLKKYGRKASMVISRMGDPAEAEKALASSREFLKGVSAAGKEATKAQAEQVAKIFGNIEASLKSAKAREESIARIVGKAAAPLAVETWVNGSPLTDADLKGKVVLLDFWAVWCGPCIATFPHLREWNEKYADKGLVMIGLTKYYNYNWDGDKAVRAEGKVEPAAEQAMLGKFAGQHELSHRFGVQAGNEMSTYYGVTGIPHVVVIDREGKVRMMKVGSGEANAKAIGDLLEKLLAEPVTGGE